jgi:hypothetical protein
MLEMVKMGVGFFDLEQVELNRRSTENVILRWSGNGVRTARRNDARRGREMAVLKSVFLGRQKVLTDETSQKRTIVEAEVRGCQLGW